jgi:hypothetical protein
MTRKQIRAALAVLGVAKVRKALPALKTKATGNWATCFVGRALGSKDQNELDAINRLHAWRDERDANWDERYDASYTLSGAFEGSAADRARLAEEARAYVARRKSA